MVGPIQIFRKIEKVNYKIQVSDSRKEKRIFHINMLKPWKEQEEILYCDQVDAKEKDDLEYVGQKARTVQDVEYDQHLNMEQLQQVQKLTVFPQSLKPDPAKLK